MVPSLVTGTCPADMALLPATRVATVAWTSPSFRNADATVEKNYAPGGAYTVGEYQVVYVAKDTNGNSDDCDFNVYLQRE